MLVGHPRRRVVELMSGFLFLKQGELYLMGGGAMSLQVPDIQAFRHGGNFEGYCYRQGS